MSTNASNKKGSAGANVAAEQLEAAVNAGRQNMENAFQAGTEAAAKGYEQFVNMSGRQFEAAFKAGGDAFRGYEDVVGFGKENLDAFVQSSAILAKGLQDINAAWFGLAQSSMDESVTAAKAMMGCKNLSDAVKVPMELAKSNYDKMMGETRKISELSMKVAEDAAHPIADRVSATVERITKRVAA